MMLCRWPELPDNVAHIYFINVNIFPCHYFLVFINIQKYETPSLVSSAQNIPQVIVAYSYTIRNYRPPNTPVTIILGLVSYQVKIPAMELNQGQEPIYLCRY